MASPAVTYFKARATPKKKQQTEPKIIEIED
jgi:hypothetical protein